MKLNRVLKLFLKKSSLNITTGWTEEHILHFTLVLLPTDSFETLLPACNLNASPQTVR
jgi:hypothetical protein